MRRHCHATTYMWRSEDKFQERFSPFTHEGPEEPTQLQTQLQPWLWAPLRNELSQCLWGSILVETLRTQSWTMSEGGACILSLFSQKDLGLGERFGVGLSSWLTGWRQLMQGPLRGLSQSPRLYQVQGSGSHQRRVFPSCPVMVTPLLLPHSPHACCDMGRMLCSQRLEFQPLLTLLTLTGSILVWQLLNSENLVWHSQTLRMPGSAFLILLLPSGLWHFLPL